MLILQNPAEGRFYASVQEVRADGRSTYNGLLLQVPRRRAGGFSLQANYTVSRCTTDRFNTGPGVDGFSGTMPGNREADEARCANSPEHNLNASAVYQIPKQGAGVLAAITGGWQIAGILSARSGGYYTVNIGSDVALSGQCCGASGAPHQRANQVLTDPFMPNRTFSQWLNPAAFERPAAGTYGTMPLDAIQGSHRWNIDTALSRSFAAVAGRCRCGLRRSTC